MAAREESTRDLAAQIFKYLWSPVVTHIRDRQHQGDANSFLSQQVFMPSHTPSSSLVQSKGASECFSGHHVPSNNEGAISGLGELTDIASTVNSQHPVSQQNEDMQFEIDPWQIAVETLYDLPLAPYEDAYNVRNHDSFLPDQHLSLEFDPWQNVASTLYYFPLESHDNIEDAQLPLSSLPNNTSLEPSTETEFTRIQFDHSQQLSCPSPVIVSAA